MVFSTEDSVKLKEIMAQSPQNQEVIQKLLDYHQYTVSKIGHELRNPLSLVYSTLQLIESTHPDVLQIKRWNFMKQDIEFMKELLEEFSMFNNGDRLCLSTFDFGEYMEHIAVSFASSLIDLDIEFTAKIEPNLPKLHADKMMLKQVILNLLKNASEAITPPGSIFLEVFQSNDNIMVQIRDTGCGLDEVLLEKAFTPFVTNKQGGSGLGLPIAQKIIAAHNGNLEVDSTLNVGTAFTITLPVS